MTGECSTLQEKAIKEAQELGDPVSDEVLSNFNEQQLWFMYLGLLNLAYPEPVSSGIKVLSIRIRDYGVRVFGWYNP
tara:strand:- start:731 stop:961 length:231 start_codon:yes stop_codon:yes gene_type:complete